MSDPEAVSRWARGFVLASVGFLLVWGALATAGVGRRIAVTLGLYGFVLHMVFGKAYSLVPSYFERELAVPRAMPVHLALTVSGVVALVAGSWSGKGALTRAGGALWLAGVGLFVAALTWTLRGNLSGAATGTSDANADRGDVDRLANAFVPVVLGYLLAGSYTMAAPAVGLPAAFDGYPPRASHLIALGGVALLVFAVGFRLLPRFLVTHPPRPLVAVTLTAGAVAPAVLAAGLGGGSGSGILGGVVAGAGGIGLGLWFAHDGVNAALVRLHLRLNLLGFLGLTIVGVAYQFYPPAVGSFRGASDRTALASIVAILAGLGIEAAGVLLGVPPLSTLGRAVALGGTGLYAWLVVGLFNERYWGE